MLIGGGCTFGLAPPVEPTVNRPVVLAAGQSSPWAIALDDTNVYWTTDNSVATVPKDKSHAASTLARAQANPAAIAVDDAYVYWTNYDDGTVMRQEKTGDTSPELLASNQGRPSGLVVDDAAVYWVDTTHDRVLKLAKADPTGTIITLASGQTSPWLLAEDSAFLYWITSRPSAVTRVAKDGSAPPQILAPALDQSYGVAVDDISVYWRDQAGAGQPGRVMKSSKTGLAMNAAPLQLASTMGEGPRFMAVDATSVYWSSGSNDSGSILSSAKDGTHPVTLAVNQAGPRGIAVDDAAVYWTNFSGATVMKLAKTMPATPDASTGH